MTKITGKKVPAERAASILHAAGLRPHEVTVLGPFIHATFRGEAPARRALRVLSVGGVFTPLSVTRSRTLNAGETGGYGSKYHDDYTAHLRLEE